MTDTLPAPEEFGPAKRVIFLYKLQSNGGDVEDALNDVSISPVTALRAYKADPAFKAEWNEAMEAASMVLESKAVKRGTKGHSRQGIDPQGNPIVIEQAPSDKLLLGVLKARKPETYGTTRVANADGTPLENRDKLIEAILLMAAGKDAGEIKDVLDKG